MPTDDALLRAVLAAPDDDAPRLIYADWLDEHGDCERAEFIRVQVALARNDKDDPRAPSLGQRERKLLAAHRARWSAPLDGAAMSWTFRRGFIEEVEMAAPVFLRRGERLFDVAPVRTVKLVRVGVSGPRLAACQTLAQVVNLDLRGAHLWASHLAPLLASPHLSRLKSLSLAGSCNQSGLAVLTGAPVLGSLTGLDLRENHLRNAGAVLLAACPRLAGLRVLDLRHNGIGVDGGNALAASPYLGGLDLLDLRGNSIDSAIPALRERFGDRLRDGGYCLLE
jgi:uncharacterized protein (TIGR02996 family)